MSEDRDPAVDSLSSALERRVAHVVRLLEGRHRTYQRAALDEAVALGEAVIPSLLSLLERAVAEPSAIVGFGGEHYAGHLYALALLTHFREVRAHPSVVALARLPEPMAEGLLGSGVSELLPAALYATAGGVLASVRAIASDPGCSIASRDAALGALAYAALAGAVDRDELIRTFGAWLTESDRSKADMDFVTAVATHSLDLYPRAILEPIEQAFRRGRIDPFALAWADFERLMQEPEEEALAVSRAAMAEALPADIHGYLLPWAGLEEPARTLDDAAREAKARQRALERQRRAERKRSRKARKRKR